MSAPKYANLYGIALDQPDVYETSELPESDQLVNIYEEDSDCIERLHISAPEAYEKFKGKEIDGSLVDFSSYSVKGRKGYDVRSLNQWELAAFGEKETILQKYNRLKMETEQLLQEISEASTKKDRPKIDQDNASDLLLQLSDGSKQLMKKITTINSDALFGYDITDSKEIECSNLLTLLDMLMDETSSEKLKVAEGEELVEDSAVKYTINLKAKGALLLHNSRIVELEKRVNKLQALIGSKTHEFVRLGGIDIDEGLIACCQWMVAKLSLLDAMQLDAIENRLVSVNTKLDQLAERKLAGDDVEMEQKINQLYELCGKEKNISQLVNKLVDRLKDLSWLHEEGTKYIRMMGNVEEIQKQIMMEISNLKSMLRNVEDSVQSNVEIIKNNVHSLNERIDLLMKRKSKT